MIIRVNFSIKYKMIIRLATGFVMLMTPGIVLAQGEIQWPYSTDYAQTAADAKEGVDHYESGNLFARGPITATGETRIVNGNTRKEETYTLYERSGQWTIYYDSAVSIVKSTGPYDAGKKNGLWKVFDKKGRLKAEYVFVDDFVKIHAEFNESGERRTIVYLSDATVWVENNKT